jgi:ADP-ribose pyrophosphatase YjhB (NUDIX family)
MSKTKTCGLYIVNKDNKILICHPTFHSWDLWSIPKGKVEEGESYLEAAIRETEEETNINFNLAIGKIKFHDLGHTTYKSKRKILVGFAVLEKEFGPNMPFKLANIDIKCNSIVDGKDFLENDSFKWVTIEEAKELLHESQVPNLEKIKKLING